MKIEAIEKIDNLLHETGKNIEEIVIDEIKRLKKFPKIRVCKPGTWKWEKDIIDLDTYLKGTEEKEGLFIEMPKNYMGEACVLLPNGLFYIEIKNQTVSIDHKDREKNEPHMLLTDSGFRGLPLVTARAYQRKTAIKKEKYVNYAVNLLYDFTTFTTLVKFYKKNRK